MWFGRLVGVELSLRDNSTPTNRLKRKTRTPFEMLMELAGSTRFELCPRLAQTAGHELG